MSRRYVFVGEQRSRRAIARLYGMRARIKGQGPCSLLTDQQVACIVGSRRGAWQEVRVTTVASSVPAAGTGGRVFPFLPVRPAWLGR
jgi:hypothetical protein